MKIRQPNLFIVGAPKAGTTFLFAALKDHPELHFPKIKELNHFSFDELSVNSYYKDYKIKERKKYLSLYSSAENQKYIVDASVSYFAFPSVAEKLYQFNPDSKIIIALRNPIKRAFSHYQIDKRMGHAEESFMSYIAGHKNDPHYLQYVQNSLYFENISNYLKYFKRENIHILLLEKIEAELDGLYQFLGIERIDSSVTTDTVVNANKAPRNSVARYLQKNRKLVSALKFVVPKKLINGFKNVLYKPAPKTTIDKESAIFLYNCFRNDIQSLSDLINVDLFQLWDLKNIHHEQGS